MKRVAKWLLGICGLGVLAGVLWIAAVIAVEQYHIAKVCPNDMGCKYYYQQRCASLLPCKNFAQYYQYKRTTAEWAHKAYLKKYPTQEERDREFQEMMERLRNVGKPERDVRWQSAPAWRTLLPHDAVSGAQVRTVQRWEAGDITITPRTRAQVMALAYMPANF